VEVLGVAARPQGQADHGVLVDAGQAAGLADADALLEVGQDSDGFVIGEAAVEQGGPLAFAEAVLTGAAGEVTPLRDATIAEGDAEVTQATSAVVGAVGILAAAVLEFVHGVYWFSENRNFAFGGVASVEGLRRSPIRL
jgi:hypothetical protein